MEPLSSLFADLAIDLLRQGKGIRFRASGRSMYPTIREGEAITVEPVAAYSVRAGDIILYHLDDQLVAHRVIRLNRNDNGSLCFMLRGDTWGTRDQPVAADQILGKVVLVERNGRSVDVYSRKMKMRLMAHTVASRLMRLVS